MHAIILFILFIIIYYSPLSSPRLSSFSILSPLLTPSPFYLLPASLSPTYCLPLLLPFTFLLPSFILAFIPLLTSAPPPPRTLSSIPLTSSPLISFHLLQAHHQSSHACGRQALLTVSTHWDSDWNNHTCSLCTFGSTASCGGSYKT